MTTFTREWLQQTIADFESTRDDAPFGLDEDDAKILAALKLALAAMQQEPVLSVIFKDGWPESNSAAITTTAPKFADGVYEFYAAPPAPVVPPERPADSSNGDDVEAWFDEGWNACRAAMLQAGNSPVIPDGWVMVPKEMTDAIGEAIAMQANCCGGIALDIYDAMLAAAPQQ